MNSRRYASVSHKGNISVSEVDKDVQRWGRGSAA
jgi:hypothetical protein